MYRKLDFKEISKNLNTIKEDKIYTTKELDDLFILAGMSKNSYLRAAFIKNGVIECLGYNAYKFKKNPIYFEDIKHAYEIYRSKRNTFQQKTRTKNTSVTTDNTLESKIQEAIKLLKSCGNRFKIYELIEYKEV